MDYKEFLSFSGNTPPGFVVGGFILGLLIVWELVWKALALWRAARDNQPIWFVAILIFNTIGILPILYLYVFSKKKS